MNKLSAIIGSLVLFLPAVSLANINTLNSLSANNQFTATTTGTSTMHMRIVTVGTDTHRFEWDDSLWNVAQGGTGASAFANGSILFIQNGVFSQNNSALFWDSTSNSLGIGGTTTPAAKLSIKGSPDLAPLNVASSTGTSLLYVSSAGDVGINTISPSAKLHIVGNLLVSGTTSFGGTTDVTGALYSHLVTATSSAINWNLGNVQSFTLTSNPTFTFTGGQAGGVYKFILTQDATGGRTVTWPESVEWPNSTTPTLTSSASSTDLFEFVYDGTDYLGSYSLDFRTPGSEIALDSADSAMSVGASTSTLSFSHTTAGTNRILFVFIETTAVTTDVLTTSGAVKYNNENMTRIASTTFSDGGDGMVYLYYKVAPSTGSNNITITADASMSLIRATAVSYTGASQTGVPDAQSTNSGSASSGSGTVTVVEDGAWIVMGQANNAGEPTAGANTTRRGTSSGGGFGYFDSNGPRSPGSNSLNWSQPGSSGYGTVTASFAPAD